jgi:hypothetical protein
MLLIFVINACGQQKDVSMKKPKDLQPKDEDPEWPSGIKNNMVVVIKKACALQSETNATLSAQEARKN